MAVAEMLKLNLAAMSYDRDGILNALQRSGAAEIKKHCETPSAHPLSTDSGELKSYLARVENALGVLSEEVDGYNKDNKIKSDELKDGFAVSYSEFVGAADFKAAADELTDKIYGYEAERKSLNSEKAKIERELKTAEIYSEVCEPFEKFSDTKSARVRLGTVSAAGKEELLSVSDGLCAFNELYRTDESSLVLCVWHKSFDGEGTLSAAGFAACPYKEGTGESVYNSLKTRAAEIDARLEEIKREIYALGKSVKSLKIYCDLVGFEVEKLELSDKMLGTQRTFLLEAYVPKNAEARVTEELKSVTGALWLNFSEPSDDEIPPTLYENNEVVKNFETITNMYSPVNSREFDPNAIMSVFYSIFLGFIMGDVGYGLLMLLGGGFIYMKRRHEDSGLKRLSGVFAVGGICAIVWGLLFNSVFGIPLPFMPALMPDAQSDMWSFMGISVPAVLIIALIIGIIHLMTGYVCKAIQCMRRGYFWDGVFDGLVWTVFSVGVALAVVGLIDEVGMPLLAYIGGGIAGVSLVIAMLTAGRKEKLLGKFTKGFGAAYGIINYASDILSYARLYGLMLSGAVIAQIVSAYVVNPAIMDMEGVGFLFSGNPLLIALGVVLMVVGHAFNLAIGLLGAYIHDARLQYVEFYGRFYEGEGEIFTPVGSVRKFIRIKADAGSGIASAQSAAGD